MEMRLGINADSGTINGNLAVLDSMLKQFQELGFSYVELPVHGFDCILNGHLVPCVCSEVYRVLERYSFSYTVHAPDALNLATSDYPETQIAALKATIDFASNIGARVVVYHGSVIDGRKAPLNEQKNATSEQQPLTSWKEEIARLKDIAEYAATKAVIVAVENIVRQRPDEITYRTDPRQLMSVVSAVQSDSLGICFDFGHAFISANQEGFSIEDALSAVLPRLVHVHVHDNFGKIEPPGQKTINMAFQGKGDLHLIPGWGSIPYDRLFPLFAPSYKGVLMMEIQPRFGAFYRRAIEWASDMISLYSEA